MCISSSTKGTTLSLKTTVVNRGTSKQAQQWDTGVARLSLGWSHFASGKTTLPLELQPWARRSWWFATEESRPRRRAMARVSHRSIERQPSASMDCDG